MAVPPGDRGRQEAIHASAPILSPAAGAAAAGPEPSTPPVGKDPFWKFNKHDRYDCPLRERPAAAPFHLGGTFEDFLTGNDMRRYAWRHMVCAEEPASWREKDIFAAEAEERLADTPFGRRLHELLLLRGHQQLRRTTIKLDWWIGELKHDTDSGAADVWLLLSRGLEVLPEGTDFKVQHFDNYGSTREFIHEADGTITDMAEVVDAALLDAREHRFVQTYEVAARQAGFPMEENLPELITPLSVLRKETGFGEFKDRCISDASAEDGDGVSLNKLIVMTQACRLASVSIARAGCGKHHAGWVVDQENAFPSLPVAAHSLRHLCFRWRGELLCFVRCNLGMRHTPAAQNSVSVCFARITARYARLGGLRVGPVASFDQRQPVNVPLNETQGLYTRCRRAAHEQLLAQLDDPLVSAALRRVAPITPHGELTPLVLAADAVSGGIAGEVSGARRAWLDLRTKVLMKDEREAARRVHSCDCLLQYLDDSMSSGTVMAQWFTFLTFLTVCMNGGFRLNMKTNAAGSYMKCQCPHSRFVYQSLQWDLHAFTLRITAFSTATILAKMRRPAQQGGMTLKQLSSLIGSLNWASEVWGTGPYKRALLDIQLEFMAGRKWTRHLASQRVELGPAFTRTAELWEYLVTMFGTVPVATGMRQHLCPFVLTSDASGDKWSYHISGLGVYDCGDFPAHWAEFIFHHSKYKEIFIGHLEALAMLKGLRYLCPRCPNVKIKLLTDNSGLMHQLRRLSAKDTFMITILREVVVLLATFGCTLSAHHIRSELNKLCDYLGRQGQSSFTAQQRDCLDKLCAAADTQRAKAASEGLLAVQAPARAELLPLLLAERVHALELDTSWGPQREEELDDLLLAHAAVHGRYLERKDVHMAEEQARRAREKEE